MCLRGRGEKKAGPAAAFGPRRQRLVQNSRWQSELVFGGAASSGGFRVAADSKVGIRPKLLTLFQLLLCCLCVAWTGKALVLLPMQFDSEAPHDFSNAAGITH